MTVAVMLLAIVNAQAAESLALAPERQGTKR